MKRIGLAAILLALCLLPACPSVPGASVLFQYSTINALLVGLYDGELTVGQLRSHGDFGLGTFNTLDGEMVVLNHNVYRVDSDGNVAIVPDYQRVPFAAVHFFDNDFVTEVPEGSDYDAFATAVESALPSRNLFYGIRVRGAFPYIKTRSVPAQEPPYPPLADVIENQSEFEFENVNGTLVGYWCPALAGNVNAVGFHLHFLTDDRRAGGHVLAFTIGENRVDIDAVEEFHLLLPTNDAFLDADLTAPSDKAAGVSAFSGLL